MARTLSRVNFTPTCRPIASMARATSTVGVRVGPSPPHSVSPPATASGPISVNVDTGTSRATSSPAPTDTATKASDVSHPPQDPSAPPAPLAAPAPCPVCGWNTSPTTRGRVTSTSSTRRYCRIDTTRASAPSSSATDVMPDAPPAAMENRPVAKEIGCRRARMTPPSRLRSSVATVTTTTDGQSAAIWRSADRVTVSPMVTPTRAWASTTLQRGSRGACGDPSASTAPAVNPANSDGDGRCRSASPTQTTTPTARPLASERAGGEVTPAP